MTAERLAKQWTNVGIDALNSGRLAQAKSLFVRATTENPQDQMAHIHLARTLRRENELEPAIEHLQRGLALSGNRDPGLMAELGELYLETEQWSAASEQAERALSIDHRCAAAWALQARIHHARGDRESALSGFQHAASLDPGLKEIQLSIAQIYHQTGQPLRALSAIEQLAGGYPADHAPEAILLAKGEILLDLQQASAALDVFQSAANRQDATRDALVRLSQAQVRIGQFGQAQSTLVQARERFPEHTAQFDQLASQLQSAPERMAAR